MSITRISTLAALLVSVCAAPAAAEDSAADYYFVGNSKLASYATVASMSNQIAELEARLAAWENNGCDANGCDANGCDANGCDAAGCGCDSGCDSGCGSCCNSCCWNWWTNPCCGLTGMAEVVWLRPQYSDSGSGTRFHHGSRFTVGYLNDCGRELRVRYFELGGTLNDPGEFLNIETIDIEYANRFSWGCNLAGEFVMGVRWADFNDKQDPGSPHKYDDTIGPLVGLHLKTDQIACNTNLYANMRYSIVFGKEQGGQLSSVDITELQIGLEWTRELAAADLFVRLFGEAQYWGGDFDSSDEHLGLGGIGLALGVTR